MAEPVAVVVARRQGRGRCWGREQGEEVVCYLGEVQMPFAWQTRVEAGAARFFEPPPMNGRKWEGLD